MYIGVMRKPLPHPALLLVLLPLSLACTSLPGKWAAAAESGPWSVYGVQNWTDGYLLNSLSLEYFITANKFSLSNDIAYLFSKPTIAF